MEITVEVRLMTRREIPITTITILVHHLRTDVVVVDVYTQKVRVHVQPVDMSILQDNVPTTLIGLIELNVVIVVKQVTIPNPVLHFQLTTDLKSPESLMDADFKFVTTDYVRTSSLEDSAGINSCAGS
jgi:hypothetical protein